MRRLLTLRDHVIAPVLVGVRSVGTPLDASHVRRDFGALCKKAGIEGVWAPRDLRHTFVSVMSVSGVAVEEIARLAGHASSRTTETIYRYTSSVRSSPPALKLRDGQDLHCRAA